MLTHNSLGQWLGRLRRTHLKWEFVYAVPALLIGLVMLVRIPPFYAFDEEQHFLRAWDIAEFDLACSSDGMANIPSSTSDEINLWYITPRTDIHVADIWERFGREIGTSHIDGQLWSCPYQPLGYLPQALGIGLVRLFDGSPLLGLYAARLAVLAATTLITTIAIKKLPFGKPIFVLIALFPMTLHQSASAGLDAITTAGVLLFVALVIAALRRERISLRHQIGLIVASLLLLSFKQNYQLVALLLLAVSPRQLGGWWRWVLFQACHLIPHALIGVAIFSAGSGGREIASLLFPLDATAQLNYVLHEPLAFVKNLASELINSPIAYFTSAVGFLNRFGLSLGQGIAFVYGVLLIWIIARGEPGPTLRPRERWWFAAVLAINVIAIFVAFYILFTTPYATHIEGVAGRYFPSLIAIGALIVYGLHFSSRQLRLAVIAVSLVGGLVLWSAYGVYYRDRPEPRFYIPPYGTQTSDGFSRITLVEGLERTSPQTFEVTGSPATLTIDTTTLTGVSVRIGGVDGITLRYPEYAQAPADKIEGGSFTLNIPELNKPYRGQLRSLVIELAPTGSEITIDKLEVIQ